MLEEGGPTSHIAIVARALGIPAVGEVANATALCDAGDAIIVDGVAGEIQVRPGPEVEAAYAEMVRLRARRQEQYRALRDVPAQSPATASRSACSSMPACSSTSATCTETGAEGIGLFRTELQFMVAQRMPSAAEQQALYASVFAATGDLPVTVRTLDIGGDKILPYMPSLRRRTRRSAGGRSASASTGRRCCGCSSGPCSRRRAGGPLKIMFPMVATVDEFVRAKAIVEREKAHLRRHGHAPAERVPPRRHGRGALAAVPDRRDRPGRRLPVGRAPTT